MDKIELSEAAKADIQDIASYTRQQYGRPQAKIYTDKIFHHIEILAQTPYVGHARPDIPEAYKAKNAEKHVIVYTQRQGTIYIARILHSRMDFTGQNIH